MARTRPITDQLRFLSQATGEHVLDTYLEACERGGRTLPDILTDVWDAATGQFRGEIIQHRYTADYMLQARAGDFVDPEAGWTDIHYFFRPKGTFVAGTPYAIHDMVKLSNGNLYFTNTAGSFADETAYVAAGQQLILDYTSVEALKDTAQASSITAIIMKEGAEAARLGAIAAKDDAEAAAADAAASETSAADSASGAASSATDAEAAQTAAEEAQAAAEAAAGAAGAGTYLPLAGGEMTGQLDITDADIDLSGGDINVTVDTGTPRGVYFEDSGGVFQGKLLLSSANQLYMDGPVTPSATLSSRILFEPSGIVKMRRIGTADDLWSAWLDYTTATDLPSTSSIVTRERGDARYLQSALAASTYLTQADASSLYLAQADAAATYLPLSGGTLTGPLAITDADLTVKRTSGEKGLALANASDTIIGRAVIDGSNSFIIDGPVAASATLRSRMAFDPSGAVSFRRIGPADATHAADLDYTTATDLPSASSIVTRARGDARYALPSAIPPVYQTRDAANAAAIAALGNGATGIMAGLAYRVDTTAGATVRCCTNDLAVNNLVPVWPATYGHFGAAGNGATNDAPAITNALKSGHPIMNPRNAIYQCTGVVAVPDAGSVYLRGGIHRFTGATHGLNFANVSTTALTTIDIDEIDVLQSVNTTGHGIRATWTADVVAAFRGSVFIRLGDNVTIGGVGIETGSWATALYLDNPQNALIGALHLVGKRDLGQAIGTDARIFRTGTTAIHITSTDDGSPVNIRLRHVQVKHTETAIKVRGRMEGILVEHPIIVACRDGIDVDLTDLIETPDPIDPWVNISNGHSNCSRYPLKVTRAAHVHISKMLLYRFNDATDVDFTGFYLSGVDRFMLSDINVNGQLSAGSQTYRHGALIDCKRGQIGPTNAINCEQPLEVSGTNTKDLAIQTPSMTSDPVSNLVTITTAPESEVRTYTPVGNGITVSTGAVMVPAANTAQLSMDIPVQRGMVFAAEAIFQITKGATSGKTRISIVMTGVSASTDIGSNLKIFDDNHQATHQWNDVGKGYFTCTANGTLTLQLSASSQGSDSAAEFVLRARRIA
ncbi:hypothetical protein [Poseidonocella sp. HB161398]|uniref:hypothetical protein n=1 Tax=Poseidonocella sp. HB161398 TaxID=2320855 RepID=UPI001108BDAB|nr:hypothetical protein [Poseidonocella sp. HB161398]